MWCRLSRMSNTEETSIMVQGVTDEEKTFDDSSFGFVCLISLRSVGLDKRISRSWVRPSHISSGVYLELEC